MDNQIRAKIKPGFSLIELLVAMAMVGIGLIGVASLAAQNIRVQYFNRNSLISAQLAQEGLEIARNRRDNNWKSSSTVYLHDTYYDDFILDYTGHYQATSGNINDTPVLKIDGDGFYSYSGSIETPFRRLLTSDCHHDSIIGVDYCLISCFVSWEGQGQSGDYQVEDYLYAWYD
jgi:prepilin-type N-terminal cleavage/methylation domain-containing protein